MPRGAAYGTLLIVGHYHPEMNQKCFDMTIMRREHTFHFDARLVCIAALQMILLTIHLCVQNHRHPNCVDSTVAQSRM